MSKIDKKTFTFVELLVVVSVISVLVALLLPVLTRARHKALRTGCLNHLKHIGISLYQYGDDFEGNIPPTDPLLGYNGVSDNRIRESIAIGGAPLGLGTLLTYGDEDMLGCPGHNPQTPKEVRNGISGVDTVFSGYLYRETDNNFFPKLDQNFRFPAVVMDYSRVQPLLPTQVAHSYNWANILFYDGHVSGFRNTETVNELFTHDTTDGSFDAIWDNADANQ